MLVGLSVRVPGCQKLEMTAYNPLWHRMLYTYHMAIVRVKGLICRSTDRLGRELEETVVCRHIDACLLPVAEQNQQISSVLR